MHDKEKNICDEPTIMNQCRRQSAREVLEQLIIEYRRKADNLEALYNSLPLKMSDKADEALWQVLICIRNK